MSKRTKKLGILARFGTRYGRRPRKQAEVHLKNKAAKYRCLSCRKLAVRRSAVGIWECRACRRVFTGGAFTFITKGCPAIHATVKRLRENLEAEKLSKKNVPAPIAI